MVIDNNIKNKRGFTIIEVVLVLAIAGLIFLMVFIALPALQRSQRNTQRRDDYSMLVTAVNSYMASNNGKLKNLLVSDGKTKDPNDLVASRWINESGQDPSGNPYGLEAWTFETWNGTPAGRKFPSTKVGAQYNCNDGACTPVVGKEGEFGSQVYVIIGANCNDVDKNGDPMPKSDPAARSFAVFGYLEGGGYFCQASGASNQ